MQVAFLVAAEGVEQVELTEPWEAVTKAGHTAKLVSTDSGRVQAFDHLDKADTFAVDLTVGSARPDDFAALVLPGGVANPDALRMDEDAVAFAKAFFDQGKPVAAICHAPWTLVEADVLSGRTLTSWPSLRTDITNAGGAWVDEPVRICTDGPNTLITSRKPDDLKVFCDTVLRTLREGTD
ncbi:type 1 glutamine amidotransferase domain-containing protein [Streptomyces sp. NPDC059991]|uniref:type 1 glutamine amidotransferase domain-containing protein n=1 Tax=unclassified Streptomyces TaxID=2593676 RepID=UPI0036A2DCDC